MAVDNLTTDLNNYPSELIGFAFELRKQDSEDMSFEILNGNVTPSILTHIICSNQWNPRSQKMVPSEKNSYGIHLDGGLCLRVGGGDQTVGKEDGNLSIKIVKMTDYDP